MEKSTINSIISLYLFISFADFSSYDVGFKIVCTCPLLLVCLVTHSTFFKFFFYICLFLQKKQVLMKELLTPIASKFTILLGRLDEEQDEKIQQAYADCLTNAMSLAR